MTTETELKLSIAPEAVEALLRHPHLAACPQRQHLHNTYFDTEDLALTGQKVAVRERRVGDPTQGQQTLLTVKTAGESQQGLSRRREWEAPTQPGSFDFSALVNDAPLAAALTALAAQLVPLFTTDFERLSWRLVVADGVADADVEVALDRGAILVNRQGRTASTPICELELELKSGDAAALMRLAEQLQTAALLTPTDESKAARGYALFHSLARAARR